MQPDSGVYAAWEAYWRRNGRHTPLGEYITRGKLRHIRRLLDGRNISNCIDVGCGMGDTLELLSRSAGDAVGLDLSPTAVAACRARGLRAIEGNLLDHPHVYDVVFSDGMIEHFEDFRPYLANLCRLSRRYVMIAQTNHSSLLIKISLLLERLLKPEVNVREYPHRLSAFIDECSSHSFSLVGRGSILLGGLKVLLFEKANSNAIRHTQERRKK